MIGLGDPLPDGVVDAGVQDAADGAALAALLGSLPPGRAVSAPAWCSPGEVVAVHALAVVAGAVALRAADVEEAGRVAAVVAAVLAARRP